MKKVLKKGLAFVLAVAMLMSNMAVEAFAATDGTSTKTVSSNVSSKKVPVPDDRVYITSQTYNLVSGATETVVTTNNEKGNDQRIGFMATIDGKALKSGAVKAVATYKDYQYDGKTFGMQTVPDQAKAYEKHASDNEKAIAGINADFYNLNTGEPMNAFVMDGKVCKPASGSPYFAILKDGTAVIRTSTDLSDVKEAVGGNMQIITNGKVTVDPGDYQTLKYSRTGLGIKADGSVVTYVTHGISAPTSCGETYTDVANMLLAQGCENALMLDGGGSATYASQREGEGQFTVKNNPSDGTPRTVSNCLIFVSTVASSGEFDHASLTPNNEYYTPTKEEEGIQGLLGKKVETKVQIEATGIDGAGEKCELPEGLTWEVDEESASLGTIDQNGLFTAKLDQTGVATINLLKGTEIVGTTQIGLAEPDEISFSGTGASINFEDKTNFGLTAKSKGIVLNYKDGDFDWDIEVTNKDVAGNTPLGTVENNVFTAVEKKDFAIEGNVSASYKKIDDEKLSATVFVEVGKMPIVAMDFEDIENNERGKDVVGLWDWGTTTSYFSDATENQVYQFQNYETLYYLQSTTYSSDSKWISERYTTTQPWVEQEDGTITIDFEGKTYNCTKEATYGQTGEKWVSFTDEKGDGYYYRGYVKERTWTGNYNSGGGSASAFLGADGYDMYVWHTNANKTNLASGELHGEGSQIVDATEGEVRFGEHALKLTYDFRNFSPISGTKNCNTYYRMTKPLVASGSPTGLGMWVYAPESMDNFWFWTRVHYWNGTSWASSYIHFKPAGAEKTCQYTGVNWKGWMYVEADLAPIYDAGAIVDAEHPVQVRSGESLILLTYIPGGTSDGEGHAIVMGSKTKGEFYIDNVRWVYGTNVDDMDSPQIISAKANDTILAAEEVAEINTNDVVFDINFTDPQGENYSGIDVQATQIYLDGKTLSGSGDNPDYSASADRAQTKTLSLANGEHTFTISICDNFGNRTEETYHFVIANKESSIPEVSITRAEKAELGGDYVVKITSEDLAEIASVSTTINYGNTKLFEPETAYLENNKFYDDYGNDLTLGADGLYHDPAGNIVEEPVRPNATGNYKISSAVQTLGENLTGKIRNKTLNATTRSFTATATVKETVSDNEDILTFTLPVPSTLTPVDKLPISVTVTYTTKDNQTYSVTTGDMVKENYAYYTVKPGIQVAGAESGVLTVSTADGKLVEADKVSVYDGTTQVEGTFAENVFTTSYFVGKEAGTKLNNVVVCDKNNKHYSYATEVNVAEAGAAKGDYLHYDVALSATSGDSTTTEKITWMSAYEAGSDVKAQYVTKAAYDAEGTDPFANAQITEGTSELKYFATEGKAARVNRVDITGLTPGTTYVYRVGDGTNWSEVNEFKTMSKNDTTKFMAMSDVQLGSSMTEADEAYLHAIGQATTDVDFGLQTGDFIDNPDSFAEWDSTLQTWSDEFAGIDFVRVVGNHEVYGTGAGNSHAILGIDQANKDYYSVEYGDVYVAVINQTADLKEAADWLVGDAAKTECTWKVVTCHQPIYYSNPNGSSDGHHKILKVACDKAGIDFAFSGHDHCYVRTEQMKDGTPVDLATNEETNAYVDADGYNVATQGQGTVYYICGDLGEKSRVDGYKLVNNPDFHFARASQDYDAIYVTAEADENKITLNTWNMGENGVKTLFDTFTMYTGTGICGERGEHVLTEGEVKYDAAQGKLICDRCGAYVDPKEAGFTGYAVDVNGADEYGDSQYYFLAGAVKKGIFTYGSEIWYANEKGLIDHKTENYTTNTCTENGNRMAYSPRYNYRYTGGKVPFTGHSYEEQEDGSLACSTCGHKAIDIAGWNFSLSYTSTNYNGTFKYPAVKITNPETGEKLEYATDGMGKLTDYTRVWNNNRNVGTATVVVAANPEGDYTNSKGDVTLTLKINPPLPKSVKVDSITSTEATLTWDKADQADGYRVYKKVDDKWKLVGTTEETSYVVTGLNAETNYQFAVRSYANVDDSTYVSIGYEAADAVSTAEGIDIGKASVSLSYTKTTYNGNKKNPTPTVVLDGVTLVRDKDYTVTRKNNVNAGTGTVIVTGIGNYAGEVSADFTIAPKGLTGASIVADDAVYNKDGAETKVAVTDKDGKSLKEGTDYTVEYSDNTSIGVATVTVTGKGNYKGSVIGKYTITPKDFSDFEGSVDPKADLTYTGMEITPAIKVGSLVEGTDYEVSYEDNVEAGIAVAIVTGIGNYTGEFEVEYDIAARDIEKAVVTDGSVYSYTGAAIDADLNVVDDLGASLEEYVDYEVVEYANNIEVGTASVTIEGIGNYTGTYTHEYQIETANVEGFTVILEPDTYVYSGGLRTPEVTVLSTFGSELEKDVDYTVAYEDNKNAGTATVVVTGIGNYSGTASRNFVIEKVDIEKTNISLAYSETSFTGGSKEPNVVVTTARGTTLKKGTNYTVSYINNKNAGTATAVVTGIGNYEGVAELDFTINPAQFEKKCVVSISNDTLYENGTEQKPQVSVVTNKGTALREGVSYEVEYADNVEAGTATVIVTGIKNYVGTVTKTFEIKERTDLSNFAAKLSYTKGTYTGSAKKPSVSVVSPAGEKLVLNKDFAVGYSNNVKVGTATVTVKGIGKYKGTIKKTFTIIPPQPTKLAVVKSTKTTVKVSFKRHKVANKYYIYVDGKYVGCAKTVNYYTIKNLKSRTSHNVTIKAVSVVNGKNIYSTSSSKLKIRTK